MSLLTVFNPPDAATSRQIRLYGAGAWLIGLVSLVVLSLAAPVLERIPFETDLKMIYIPTLLVAFGLMVTGCYRALTGKKTSKNVEDHEVSYARVIIGVMSVLLSLLIPATIVVACLYFVQWIGIEPNKIF